METIISVSETSDSVSEQLMSMLSAMVIFCVASPLYAFILITFSSPHIILHPVKVSLHCGELLRLNGQGTWCYDSYLWRPCYLVTKKGVRAMDRKRVYFRNDSQRYVHFWSRWLSEMVWACVNTRCDVIGNVKTFESKFYHIAATKTYVQYPWKSKNYGITCSLFSVDFM